MSNPGNSFGKQLRAVRIACNLMQVDVEDQSYKIAESEGSCDFVIRNSQLSLIEHGHALPGPAKLLALGEIYELSLDQLITLWATIKSR